MINITLTRKFFNNNSEHYGPKDISLMEGKLIRLVSNKPLDLIDKLLLDIHYLLLEIDELEKSIKSLEEDYRRIELIKNL